MVANKNSSRRKQRKIRPVDETALRDLAMNYAARYATTAEKLRGYLQRKLRERGVVEDETMRDPAQVVEQIVERLVELRYVDDEAYAKARTGSLLRRGYGKRRVNEALRHAGVDEFTREETAPGDFAQYEAAVTLARKKRFGPFGHEHHDHNEFEPSRLDPAKREKQMAAMLRAGHSFDVAKRILDAGSVIDIESWLDETATDDE